MTSRKQQRADAVAKRQRQADALAQQRRNRMLLWGGLAVVVVIAVIVAVVASSGGDSAKATTFETAKVTVQGTPLPPYNELLYSGTDKDPAIGKTIPTLKGKSVFDGAPVTVAPNDKPQMVLFVAHWCPHCQAEVPRMVTLAKQGVFDGVDVTAVATGTNPAADNYPPSAWLKRVDWPFTVMADSPDSTAATAYGIPSYPYFVLVNADGTVAARATGEVPPDQIAANVKALKAGKPLPLLSSGASSSAG